MLGKCKDCRWFTTWEGFEGAPAWSQGPCHYNPKHELKSGEDFCSRWAPRNTSDGAGLLEVWDELGCLTRGE